MIWAALFPGQGSQFVGMGRPLFESSPAARAIFEAADNQLGFALSDLCFDGPEERLTDTVNQQPALFTASLAAWRAWEETGDQPPAYVAGHSLGELSALVAAGSLSFADGLALVRKRGQLMKEAGDHHPGAMAAILNLEADRLESLCEQVAAQTGLVVQIANDNCPGQIVVSGDEEALERVMALATEAGARKVVRLPITIAAHSPLMGQAAQEFGNAVDDTPLTPPLIPIIGNVEAQPLSDVAAIRRELKAQLTAPVSWTPSMRYLLQRGVERFVEMGPDKVLLGLLKRIDRRVQRVEFALVPAAGSHRPEENSLVA